MKLYFAGAEVATHVQTINHAVPGANMLCAFSPNTKMATHLQGRTNDMFLDSGAFTAFTKGKTINIDEYIAFIKATKSLWNVYAGLDVIGNAGASQKNMEYMEAKGLAPLPTFHYQSPEKDLRRLIDNYPYIALGGLVPIARQRSTIQAWLDYCFSIIKTDTKVHGFGVNSFHIMKRYPFFSVDASSWIVHAQRLATVVVFEDGNLLAHGGFGEKGELETQRPELIFDFKDSPGDSRYIARSHQAIREYKKAEEYVTKLWEKRGIVWED